MNEREKVLKAFNQCSDALSNLDANSILKVFQLLSVQFDIITFQNNNETNLNKQTESTPIYLPPNQSYSEEKPEEDIREKKPIKSSPVRKGKQPNSKNPQYLSDFDFRPTGKDSLKDFFSRYESKSNLERNLIFTYYLQEVLGTQGISINHIFSCYRHLNLKIPFFPQTLIDTKKRKGWIDTADTNNLKVTREGINHFEHDFTKKNG